MSLYVVAFASMLVAAVLVAVGSPPFAEFDDRSLRLLRISAGFSVAAIVLALASVIVPRRR